MQQNQENFSGFLLQFFLQITSEGSHKYYLVEKSFSQEDDEATNLYIELNAKEK